MVDKYTGELVPHRPVDQCGRNRRIDTAAQGTKHLPVANRFADFFDLLINESFHRPIRFKSTNGVHEIFQQIRPVGLMDIRIKLNGIALFSGIADRSYGSPGSQSIDGKIGRRLLQHIFLNHPTSLPHGGILKKASRILHQNLGLAIIPFSGFFRPASELFGHQFHAVADA